MAAIKRVRLSESVIDAIREMIAKDGFAPGDKFYSEKILTEKLDVSRSSVREALRILEVTGQVKVRQGKGTFIADSGENNEDLEGFTTWLRNNEQTILDHFEVRLILEPRAAWTAAKCATSDDILKMERACEDFEHNARISDTAATIECDREFHHLLSRSTKNQTLEFVMKSMTKFLPDGWISSLYTPGRIEKTVIEHRNVLLAVKKGDAAAAMKSMEAHLDNAIVDIMAMYRASRDTD